MNTGFTPYQQKELSMACHEINERLASQSVMSIGAEIRHPDGYMVKVKSGQYLDPTYGRVSNWWTWNRINEDGTLNPKDESGYGW